jgi:periplasmic copper chaperone A
VKRWLLLIASCVLIVAALCACAPQMEPGIHIDDAWVRPAPMAGGTGAAYMQISNGGPGDDRLIGVRADFAESVEIHESVHADGMASMHSVDAIDLPAGSTIMLETGGYHAMLINVAEPLQPGDMVTLTLIFEKAGDIEISAEVRAE